MNFFFQSGWRALNSFIFFAYYLLLFIHSYLIGFFSWFELNGKALHEFFTKYLHTLLLLLWTITLPFLVVEMGNKNIFKLTFCQVIQWGKSYLVVVVVVLCIFKLKYPLLISRKKWVSFGWINICCVPITITISYKTLVNILTYMIWAKSCTSQLQIHDSTMNIVLIHTYRLECFSTIQISIGIAIDGYNFNHHYAWLKKSITL